MRIIVSHNACESTIWKELDDGQNGFVTDPPTLWKQGEALA